MAGKHVPLMVANWRRVRARHVGHPKVVGCIILRCRQRLLLATRKHSIVPICITTGIIIVITITMVIGRPPWMAGTACSQASHVSATLKGAGPSYLASWAPYPRIPSFHLSLFRARGRRPCSQKSDKNLISSCCQFMHAPSAGIGILARPGQESWPCMPQWNALCHMSELLQEWTQRVHML